MIQLWFFSTHEFPVMLNSMVENSITDTIPASVIDNSITDTIDYGVHTDEHKGIVAEEITNIPYTTPEQLSEMDTTLEDTSNEDISTVPVIEPIPATEIEDSSFPNDKMDNYDMPTTTTTEITTINNRNIWGKL